VRDTVSIYIVEDTARQDNGGHGEDDGRDKRRNHPSKRKERRTEEKSYNGNVLHIKYVLPE